MILKVPMMLEKIANLLKTGRRKNIELAYQLSLSTKTNLWPLERGIKDLLYLSHTQPIIHFDNLPLGQLCYLLNEVIALNISKATVEELPEQLYFMHALVIVELLDTPLKSIPQSICSLTKLKSLSIKNSQISSLPDQLHQLPSLERLTLVGNPNLTQLPSNLVNLPKLKTLRISSGLQSSLPQGEFNFELIVV